MSDQESNAADRGSELTDGLGAGAGARKPTREDLLLVIGRLQDLIGQAMGAAQNDRATDRADRVAAALNPAFELCVAALSFDPAPRPRTKRPNDEFSGPRAAAGEAGRP